MTDRCAWCGKAVPAKRAGRKGARAFCDRGCNDAFTAAAWKIGAAHLAAAKHPETGETRFNDWLVNNRLPQNGEGARRADAGLVPEAR